jgi:hypothetical protein
MYHLHCKVCGVLVAATQDAAQAAGDEHYCRAHRPQESPVGEAPPQVVEIKPKATTPARRSKQKETK